MNVMQMQILMKNILAQEIERISTRTMSDRLTEIESFASMFF